MSWMARSGKSRVGACLFLAVLAALAWPTGALAVPTANSSTLTVVTGAQRANIYPSVGGASGTVTLTLVTAPAHGKIEYYSGGVYKVLSAGSTSPRTYWYYTPTAGYVGSDSFVWKATDSTGSSGNATCSITVKANTLPVANNQSLTAIQQTTLSFALSFTDPDSGQTRTFTLVTAPTKGTLKVGTTVLTAGSTTTYSSWTYTGNAGYAGSDSFVWKVSDGLATSGNATCSITVKANTIPKANNQSVTVIQQTALSFALNFTDPDAGQTKSYTLVTAPTKGTLKYGSTVLTAGSTVAGNSWNYTGNAGYVGSDSFVWKMSDGIASSANATCSITVKANTIPVANNQAVNLVTGASLGISLSWTDPDAGQAKSYTLVAAPTRGTLKYGSTVLTAGSTVTYNSWTYTPNAGYVGSDSFVWKLSDGIASSANGTCSITVRPNAPPVIENLSPTVTFLKNTANNTLLCMKWTHVDVGQTVKFTLVAAPTKGTFKAGGTTLTTGGTVASVLATTVYTYTPNAGYVGTDSFKWKLNDGMDDSATATVAVNVIDYSAAGPAPQLMAGAPVMDGAEPLRVWRIPRNGMYDYANKEVKYLGTAVWRPSMAAPELVDWDNDGLTDLLVGQADGRVALFRNEGAKGNPVFNGFRYLTLHNGKDLYSMQVGCSCFGGGDSCAVPRVFDWNDDGRKDLIIGTWGPNAQYVYETGIAVFLNVGSDADPVFTNKVDALLQTTVTRDGICSGGRPTPAPFITDMNNDGIPDVISGDNNVWFDTTGKYGPATGSPKSLINVFLASRRDLSPDAGAVLPLSGGFPYYYPVSSFHSSSSTKVPPTMTLSAACPVGSRKSVVAVDWNGNGKKDLITGMQDGTIWFSPNVGSPALPVYTNHYRLTAGGQPIVIGDPAKVGTDRAYFNYTGDYHGGSNLRTVNEARLAVGDLDGDGLEDLVVGDVNGYVTLFQRYNPKPVAMDLKVVAMPNKPKSIELSARSDDGHSLTYSVLGQPAHGALSGTAPNLTYTPASGYTGPDSFTFKAADGSLYDMGTVSIQVKTHTPVAKGRDMPLRVTRNATLPVELKVTDDGNEPLTYTIVTPPVHGTLSGTAPNLTYTPASGYSGPDSFSFKANDGYSDSNVATIPLDVLVLGINFQPLTVPTPAGYKADNGAVYDAARSYGWNTNLTAKAYGYETDPRVDSAVSSLRPATWTADLPNGNYFVTAACGTWFTAGNYERLAVQGNLVLDGPRKGWSGEQEYQVAGNVPAAITAGKLAVTIGGVSNDSPTRLDHLEIRNVRQPLGGAVFVKEDTTTQGNWKGVYGSEGHFIVNSSKMLPDYVHNFDPYRLYRVSNPTWADPTTDGRALQHAWDIDQARVASGWEARSDLPWPIPLDINLLDGQTHQVAIYFLDWGGSGVREQRVDILDAGDTNTVLHSRIVSNYVNGKYLVWNLRGHVKIMIWPVAGTTMRASAVFFGGASQPADPPVLTSVTVAPATASVAVGGTQPFTATARDQYGQPMASQPTFTWTVSGGGTISTAGLFTAGSTAGGPYTVTASSGGKSGTASVTVTTAANAAPTVATAAKATPSPATGTTTALSVLGADDGGEANLTYTWTTTGTPPAPVTFSANNSNAAKNTTATFTKAGTYQLQVTIKDAQGLTVTSSVSVTVNQTLTTIAVAPTSASVLTGGTQQFTATARDQFGANLSTQPAFTWTVSGGGTISTAGLFTAGTTAGGPYTVTASTGGKSGTASVTVTAPNQAPTVAITSPANGASFTAPASISIAANASDSDGSVAKVEFYQGSTKLGEDTTSPYSYTWNSVAAGSYSLTAKATDNAGASKVSAAISITVTAANAAPTVATAAKATPSPATGTTTALSVLGADDGGEANLTYTWTTTGTPPAPVTFSANNSNAAKNTTATFTKAGTYQFQVTIKDAAGLTVTSSVSVTVNQTLTTIAVAPTSASVPGGGTQSFTATARDQFAANLSTQPTFAWTVSGGGSISSAGLFTAGTTAGGPYTVTASSGGKSGTASVTVTAASTEVIVDDKDANTSRSGTWLVSAASYPHNGQSLYSDSAGTFRWTPTLSEAGTYEVYAWWTYHANRATNVPYRVTHAGGTATVKVNQRDSALGGKWNLLGTYSFNAGSAGYVTVSSENGQACADAVKLVRTGALPPPVVRIYIYDGKIAEPVDPGQVNVYVDRTLTEPLTVSYAVSGTAGKGVDYTTLSGSVTIPAGKKDAAVIITPLDDTLVEGSETILLTLQANPAYTVGSQSSLTLYLCDNEKPEVTVRTADSKAAEIGGDNALFQLVRHPVTASPLTVKYVMSGTASNGVDYTALSGTAVIPAGAATVDVPIVPITDTLSEGSESLTLTLLDNAAYTVGTARSGWPVAIYDDERPQVDVSYTDRTASEPGTDTGTIRFTIKPAVNRTLTIKYSVSGTATAGADYTALPGTVSAPANASYVDVVVRPLDDTLQEGDEKVTLNLLSDAAYQSGWGTQTVTITDND